MKQRVKLSATGLAFGKQTSTNRITGTALRYFKDRAGTPMVKVLRDGNRKPCFYLQEFWEPISSPEEILESTLNAFAQSK